MRFNFWIQVSWAIGSLLEILLAYIVLNWLGWRVWLVASSIPLLFAALLVIVSIFYLFYKIVRVSFYVHKRIKCSLQSISTKCDRHTDSQMLYPDSESIQNVKYTCCEIKTRVYFISMFYEAAILSCCFPTQLQSSTLSHSFSLCVQLLNSTALQQHIA